MESAVHLCVALCEHCLFHSGEVAEPENQALTSVAFLMVSFAFPHHQGGYPSGSQVSPLNTHQPPVPSIQRCIRDSFCGTNMLTVTLCFLDHEDLAREPSSENVPGVHMVILLYVSNMEILLLLVLFILFEMRYENLAVYIIDDLQNFLVGKCERSFPGKK